MKYRLPIALLCLCASARFALAASATTQSVDEGLLKFRADTGIKTWALLRQSLKEADVPDDWRTKLMTAFDHSYQRSLDLFAEEQALPSSPEQRAQKIKDHLQTMVREGNDA